MRKTRVMRVTIVQDHSCSDWDDLIQLSIAPTTHLRPEVTVQSYHMPDSSPFTSVTVTPIVAQVLDRMELNPKLFNTVTLDGVSDATVDWSSKLRFMAPIGRRVKGDIVEFIQPWAKTKLPELARVEAVDESDDTLRVRGVVRATDILGPRARENELFLTRESDVIYAASRTMT